MIKYYQFKYSDFFENKGGLYLRGVWTSPGLQPRDKLFFLPKQNGVYRREDNEYYTTQRAWEWYMGILRANGEYRVQSVPEPIGEGWSDVGDWKAFVELYPFEQDSTQY